MKCQMRVERIGASPVPTGGWFAAILYLVVGTTLAVVRCRMGDTKVKQVAKIY